MVSEIKMESESNIMEIERNMQEMIELVSSNGDFCDRAGNDLLIEIVHPFDESASIWDITFPYTQGLFEFQTNGIFTVVWSGYNEIGNVVVTLRFKEVD